MSRDCHHGYYARVCDRCEMERAIADLKHDIERQHEACSEHLGEIERLRAFVAAFDEWMHPAHHDPFSDEMNYNAMLAAREAIK